MFFQFSFICFSDGWDSLYWFHHCSNFPTHNLKSAENESRNVRNRMGNFYTPERVPPQLPMCPRPSSRSALEALGQFWKVRTLRTKSTRFPCLLPPHPSYFSDILSSALHPPHNDLVVLGTYQAHSCLRAFALTVPSAWDALPPSICMAPFISVSASVSHVLTTLF